jgi:hypothetical protein
MRALCNATDARRNRAAKTAISRHSTHGRTKESRGNFGKKASRA